MTATAARAARSVHILLNFLSFPYETKLATLKGIADHNIKRVLPCGHYGINCIPLYQVSPLRGTIRAASSPE